MGGDFSLQIERAAYEEFAPLWSQGRFEDQRLGQAFYNHFHGKGATVFFNSSSVL